jgi:tetratricopeptide (TPR) repeat protein
VSNALDEIRRIEGEDSSLTLYGEASFRIWRAAHPDKPGIKVEQSNLTDATRLLIRVAAQRSDWARVPLAEAKIAELKGDLAGAEEKYLRAVELGERDLEVIRHTLDLLFKARHYADASRVLAKLQDMSSFSNDLRRYAAEISLQNQDYNHALTMAEQAVSKDSKDYRDHMWLGQILSTIGRQSEGEQHLRRAVELAPEEPAPWIVLVYQLSNTHRNADADAVIQQAEAKLTPKKHALALAQCHEQVGHRDVALRLYRTAARAADSNDEATLRSVVGYMIRTNRLTEAASYLEKLVALPGERSADIQLLARILSSERDPEKSKRAMDLLGISDSRATRPATGARDAEELRAEAIVRVNRPDKENQQVGIEILKDLIARDRSPQDQFLLAQVYEKRGDWPQAKQAMVDALNSAGKTADTLALFIKSLVAHKEAAEAEPWLNELDQLAPNTLRTASLKAQVLNARGQSERAVALLEALADRNSDLWPKVAHELESLGQMKPAEEAFRKYEKYESQSAPKVPRARLELARFLGRHNRLGEGLDLCATAWTTCPPENVAMTCTDILSASHPDGAQLERVAGWLDAAVRKKPSAGVLLVALASVRYLQGRSADAEAAYRQALRLDSNELVALCNLAWLLGHEPGKEAEALDMIERALDAAVAPARPGLLDTRAVIQLAMDHADLAIRDLEESLAAQPSPVSYFHLAQAYRKAKRDREADEALRKGVALGLNSSVLDPIERPAFDEFTRK